MAKKNVKMGEEIVDQPDTQIVTPSEDTAQAEAPVVQPDPGPPPEPGTTLLLENGTRIALEPHLKNDPSRPQFRVGAVDGHIYDHCATDPATGEWVYRRQT